MVWTVYYEGDNVKRRSFLGATIGGLLAACGVKLPAHRPPLISFTNASEEVIACSPVCGTIVRWVGKDAIAEWSDPKNWDAKRVPTSDDSVIIALSDSSIICPREEIELQSIAIKTSFTGSVGTVGHLLRAHIESGGIDLGDC